MQRVQTLSFKTSSDSRGVFMKGFQKTGALADFAVQQVNFVASDSAHTLRGLHYQQGEHAECKLFRVTSGAIQLGFVDLRPSAHDRLRSGSITVDDATTGVLVPRGFATGYLTLVDHTTVLYLSDRPYVPNAERGLRWDDVAASIEWATRTPIVSPKDAAWPYWRGTGARLPD